MRPAGLDALHAVRTFLEDTVFPGVAQEHRSETRAALKILRELEAELAQLPRILQEECDELTRLCAAARDVAAAAPSPSQQRSPGLPELREQYAHARQATADTIGALQQQARDGDAKARAHLVDLYTALGCHAERRLPWQSVFPAAPTTEGAIQ